MNQASEVSRPYSRGTAHPTNSTGPVSKGHDAVLRAIQSQERTITVETLSGTLFVGQLVGRDKFTLTVRGADHRRRVIYKSAIESFYADEVAPAVTSKAE